jgi:hypothetical protein
MLHSYIEFCHLDITIGSDIFTSLDIDLLCHELTLSLANFRSCRFGRKKSVIIAMVIAFIASVIAVSIPADKNSGKSVVF